MVQPTEQITRPAQRILNKGRKAIEQRATRLESLVVEYVPIDSIFPNAYNPNRQSEHDFALLCKSMEEDGFTQPILVCKPGNIIVDGEHRWRAAHQLGYTEIPVVFVTMTDEQMRIATLRHNRARGSEDVNLSAAVLRDLRELGALDWAIDSLNIDTSDLTRLLDTLPAPEALAGATFNDSWEPGEVPRENIETSMHQISTTEQAVAIKKATAIALEKSTSSQEKQRILAADRQSVVRINVIFYHEDAVLVRSVLGDNPAPLLLQLCKEALNETHEPGPAG